MKKRIFLTVFATALITVLVSLILLVGVTYRYINEDTRDQLMAQLDYLSQAVETKASPISTSLRTTAIALLGSQPTARSFLIIGATSAAWKTMPTDRNL